MLADVFRETWALQAWTLHAGAVWQPLTYAFVHGGWAHLLANLFGLALTGAALEAVLGARRLVWLFALGAAAGAAVSEPPLLPIDEPHEQAADAAEGTPAGSDNAEAVGNAEAADNAADGQDALLGKPNTDDGQDGADGRRP